MYLYIIYYALIAELAIAMCLFFPNVIIQRYISSFIIKCFKQQHIFAILCVFYFFVIIMVVDSYMDLNKYNSFKENLTDNRNINASPCDHNNMKLFRAQRNIYLTVFTLFGGLVINRTVSLISQNERVTKN